jgi:hypothetical protein
MRPLLLGNLLLLAVAVFAVVISILFIFPGYVDSSGSISGPPGACHSSVAPDFPYQCIAAISPPPASCDNGSIADFNLEGVQFSLHSYWHCGGPGGDGIAGAVNESNYAAQTLELPRSNVPNSTGWVNWTSSDGRVNVDWPSYTGWNVTIEVS